MKKTFIMLAGVLVMAAACQQKPEPEPQPEPVKDEISVTPKSAEVENIGGTVEVLVKSSDEWTLSSTEKYDWVTPSAVEGKDGDKVVFDVKANETLEDRNAKFTFTRGEATAEFTLLSKKTVPVVRVIELAPNSLSFEAEGGSADVMVTSLANDESAAWTLAAAEEYAWVTPSASEGQDGASVKFTVAENKGKEDLAARFTFANGDATAELTVTSKAKAWTLTLTSAAEAEFGPEGGDLTVSVASNIPAESLVVTIPEEAKSWLSLTARNQGDDAVDFFFKVAANPAFEGRSSQITIGNGEDLSVAVAVSQKQTDRMEVDSKEIVLGLEGGGFVIPVVANIEYDIDLSEASGVTYEGKGENQERFTAAAVSGRTEYKIKFVPKNSTVAAVTVPVTLKTSALINYVANMRKHYAYPKTWNNAEALNNLSQFTVEMLVNIQEWREGNSISTLLGIENDFLIRMGDGSSCPHYQVQVVCNGEAKSGSYWQFGLASFNSSLKKWMNVILTFDNGKATLYLGQPGKSPANCGQVTFSKTSVNLGVPYIQEGSEGRYPNLGKYAFWIGRSYDNNRDFQGWMSEVRIWNRVLPSSEFNQANHRYYVDPASEGLVAYWRFNEDDMGTGKIKDWSASGNDLTVNNADMEFVPVSLP